MTMVMPPLSQLRDAVAVTIARALVNGEPVTTDMVREFADLDADAGHTWHDDDGHVAGSAFGL
jgi:hypothetical protein